MWKLIPQIVTLIIGLVLATTVTVSGLLKLCAPRFYLRMRDRRIADSIGNAAVAGKYESGLHLNMRLAGAFSLGVGGLLLWAVLGVIEAFPGSLRELTGPGALNPPATKWSLLMLGGALLAAGIISTSKPQTAIRWTTPRRFRLMAVTDERSVRLEARYRRFGMLLLLAGGLALLFWWKSSP